MQRRKLFWFAVSVLTLFMIAAAPPAGLCDEWTVDQLELGAPPVGSLPGLKRGIALESVPWAPAGQNSYAFGMVKTLGDDYAITARFLHHTITNAITDLGIELSDGAINCPNPSYVDLGLAQVPGSETDGLLTVAALCDGTIYGSQVVINPNSDQVRGSDWIKQTFDEAVDMNSMSASSVNVDGVLYQTVCGADGSGVYCWDPEVLISRPVQRREFTAPASQTFFTSRINHSYDGQGRIHMVGTDRDGRLGYARFPVGGTQADADSIKWVGDASINQAWDWTQVRVAPDGMVWISAFNTTEGSIYVFNKEPDSADHWYFTAVKTPDGPLGKYNSMAIEPRTGNAFLVFSDERGHARVMTVTKARQIMMKIFDAAYGQPYSTDIDTHEGMVDALTLGGDLVDPRVVRFGAKIDF